MKTLGEYSLRRKDFGRLLRAVCAAELVKENYLTVLNTLKQEDPFAVYSLLKTEQQKNVILKFQEWSLEEEFENYIKEWRHDNEFMPWREYREKWL